MDREPSGELLPEISPAEGIKSLYKLYFPRMNNFVPAVERGGRIVTLDVLRNHWDISTDAKKAELRPQMAGYEKMENDLKKVLDAEQIDDDYLARVSDIKRKLSQAPDLVTEDDRAFTENFFGMVERVWQKMIENGYSEEVLRK